MKKTFFLLVALVLVVSSTLTMSACATIEDEDAVHYSQGTIAPEDIQRVVSSTVSVPDEDPAAEAAEEDIVHYGINQYKPEDFIRLTPNTVTEERSVNGIISQAAYTELQFPDTTYNSICSDFNNYLVEDGDSVTMYIDIAVWSPGYNDLEIGIYNWTTAENWYVTKSGGHFTEYTKSFQDLTAGNYSIYIRNLGSHTLTTGYLLYSLT